jgi:hypothetical protein
MDLGCAILGLFLLGTVLIIAYVRYSTVLGNGISVLNGARKGGGGVKGTNVPVTTAPTPQYRYLLSRVRISHFSVLL